MTTDKSTGQTSLSKFKDCLRVPPILHPHKTEDQRYNLRVHMRPAQVQLHSELPPTEVWTYEGSLPGPTIEVSRGQRLQVEWINAIPGDEPYPITAVTAPDGTQNEPGRSGRPANQTVATLPPWTVVHLHGGRTAAVSDGWTENATLSGQSTTSDYTNDQQATLLWYHDHAMGITRFNVYAGLAGLYIIRDAEEEALGLPAGPYEIPLLLQDRNLETAPDGSLTGRLLHKVEDNTMEFFGPFTMVNGTIWPHLPVEARQYRLRLLWQPWTCQVCPCQCPQMGDKWTVLGRGGAESPDSPGPEASYCPEPEGRLAGLGPQERQQVGVELLLVRAHEAVGRSRIDLQGRVLDELGGEQGRVADWHDLVVIAMDDQGRNVELLEVFRLVRLGEGLDAVECTFETDLHRPQPEGVPKALRYLGTRSVGAVEGCAEILVELRAVRGDPGADLVERLDGQAARIGLRLEHQRRHRAHQHGLGQARGAVTTDVAGHLAAGGMAHQHRVSQIERFDEHR